MATYPGHPLFDTAEQLDDAQTLDRYPTLRAFLADAPQGARDDYAITRQFLSNYQDVQGTFTRFRGELQRFLIYLWCVCRRNLAQTDQDVLERYFQFIKTPPAPWIADSIQRAFLDKDDLRVGNPDWRPFVNRVGERYTVKQATLNAASSALQTFFRYLQVRGHITHNPLLHTRRRARKAQMSKAQHQPGTARRLTDWQWSYLLEALTEAASDDPAYERHLFVVVTLKALYLRVSELAPRRDGTGVMRNPVFGDFRRQLIQGEEVWDFLVFGKGDKVRRVTVPDAYLDYLRRWRSARELSPGLPLPGDEHPLVPGSDGHALGVRQIARIFEQAMRMAAQRMRDEGLADEAQVMADISTSTHYLRHTGASQDIENGADIRHISEELGHASAAFTEAVYVNADQARRYHSGKRRRV